MWTKAYKWLIAAGLFVSMMLGLWLSGRSSGKKDEQVTNSKEAAKAAMAAAEEKVAVSTAENKREVDTVKKANDVQIDVTSRTGSSADRLRKSRWNRDNKSDGS